jgi:ABC-type multidrug transport system ATPase subunit/pSer/pThr/pTyr-binding forkhead associated (FHA) protein
MTDFDPTPTQRAVAATVATERLHPPQLVVQFPDGRRQEYTLPPGPLRVGRDEQGNQIVIPANFTSISRLHLELRREPDGFHVVDLESGNGVLLNGQRIQGSAPLHDGDEICIGLASMGQEVRLSFRAGDLPQSISETTRVPAAASGPAAPPPRGDQPRLHIRLPNGQELWTTLNKDVTLIGRDHMAEVRLPTFLGFVSIRHAEIRRAPAGFQIVDLGSRNGTRVNGQLLVPNQPFPLGDGCVIRLGDDQLGVSVGLTFHASAAAPAPAPGFTVRAAAATAIQRDIVTLGRSADNQVVLAGPTVSRHHARLERQGNGVWLEDLHSAHGSYVNGQRITRVQLQFGDLVQIASHLFIYQHDGLRRYDSQGMRVDVVDLHEEVRTRQGPLRILDDIDLTVLPREFVGLVGASGAGKSTLLEALVGIRPAQGQVLLNGRSLYREIHRLRAELGYVPQADILHTALTVERALDYSAELRLPPDTTPPERQKRIAAVLDTVGLNTDVIRRTRIGQLSGGQRKRVSIAAELLADPKLFLLDEPTSGLDPGLEKKMMHTLRQMADEGRTIILITHATANLIQVDHVAFLAQGQLVYFGPPAAALPFFEVDEFADTYDRLTGRGAEWRQVFVEKKPEAYQRYVVARHATRATQPEVNAPRRSGSSPARMLRQLSVLTRRAVSLLSSDLATLCLLLLLFPLTATLQLMVGSADVLTGDPAIVADPAAAAQTRSESYVPLPKTNTFVFVMGLEAVLIGMYVPSNELIKERSIYLRERLVNLQVPAYLLSKVVVFMTFAALQTILYLMLLSLGVHLPARGLLLPGPVELFITLFLTLTAGIGLGLLVSAISRSADMAIYALVIMMFFQFFFSGTVFDLRGNPAQFLSYLTTTRWSLTAIGVTIDMPRLAESTIVCAQAPVNPLQPSAGETTRCINQRDAVNDLLLPYGHEKLLQSWGVLAGTALLTLLATGVMIKRLDPT